MVLTITLSIIVSIFIFQSTRTLFSIYSSLNFLRNNQKNTYNKLNKNIRFFILIPCLCEQEKIMGTLLYFQKICSSMKNKCFVYTITTEKEKKFINKNYTWNIIESEIKIHNYNNFYNIHYPYSNGVMSHQLNYAINYLKKWGVINESDYIVIYNADSRPHPLTLKWTFNDIQKKGLAVYQQLSSVFNNFDSFGNSLNGLFLKTFAILQTRFSLAHELPRLRRTISKNQFLKKYSNAHCIAHGLFIPYNKLKELGKFSEDIMTEDLFLGFLIRAVGSPIRPIPFLENIDSPSSIFKNLRQKYVWFWGPMYYPYYYKYYKNNFLNKKNSFRALILMFQGIFSAAAWILSGPILLIGIILIIIHINLFFSKILIFFIALYAPIQYFIILKKYNKILLYSTGKMVVKRSILEYIIIPILSPFVIILSSIPPYISIVMETYKRIFNIVLKKPKTES